MKTQSTLTQFMVLPVLASLILFGCAESDAGLTEPEVLDEALELVLELPVSKTAGDEVFMVVEQAPIMLGGSEALAERITYPELAKKAGIEGRVMVKIVVDENGHATNPRVVRGIGGGADEEALKAVTEIRFVPGMQRGERVKVQMVVPVEFKLDA